jgi:hypothetical protein
MTAQEFGAPQGNERDVETIDLELDHEELRALTQPAGRTAVGAHHPQDRPSTLDDKRPRGSSDSRARVALLLCTSAAAVLLAVGDARIARVPGVTAAQLTPAVAAPVEQPKVLAKQHAVRFVNPFDATEVFEFPAGTSKSAARAAVAKLLTERARGRFYLVRAKRARHHHRTEHARGGAMPPESSSAA